MAEKSSDRLDNDCNGLTDESDPSYVGCTDSYESNEYCDAKIMLKFVNNMIPFPMKNLRIKLGCNISV